MIVTSLTYAKQQDKKRRGEKDEIDVDEEDGGDPAYDSREELDDDEGENDGEKGRASGDERNNIVFDERGDIVFEDAPHKKASKKRRSRSSPSNPRTNSADPQRFSFNVTIAEDGQDFEIEGSRALPKDFIENQTEIANLCVERGEADQNLHWQGMIVVITTTPQAFKKEIEKALNYGSEKGQRARPVGLSISLRKLTGHGLHTKH